MYAAVAAIVIVLAGAVGVGTFFRVSEIRVEGAGVYSPEEIISASGIQMGDNLFFANGNAAAAKIRSQLTYVKNLRIEKHYPGTVILHVTEAFPIASVYSGGSSWLFDRTGKILEKVESVDPEGCIDVKGIAPIQPVVGSKLALGPENATQLKYLLDVLTEIEKLGIYKEITVLDMTYITDITFDYQNRYLVNLGTGDGADVKLQTLLRIAQEKASGSDTGTLDLSVQGEAHFIPD